MLGLWPHQSAGEGLGLMFEGQKQEEAQKEQKKRRPTREVIAPWVLGTVPFLLHGLLRVVVPGVPRILQSLLAVNSLQLHF